MWSSLVVENPENPGGFRNRAEQQSGVLKPLLSGGPEGHALAPTAPNTPSPPAHRTGVLIFASVAERYAEIVADSGINVRVTPDAWTNAVTAMVAAIKAGRTGDGFVAAVELCGAELAQYFPPGELNPNELPDRVVEI